MNEHRARTRGKKIFNILFFIRKEISVSWRGQWDFLLRCIGIIEIKRKNCQRRSQISRVKKLQKGIVKEWRVSISGSHLPPQKMQAKREEPGRILVLVQFPGLAHHTFTTFCIVKNCSPSPKQERFSWSSRLSWIRCGNNEQLFLKSVMSSLSLSEDIFTSKLATLFSRKKMTHFCMRNPGKKPSTFFEFSLGAEAKEMRESEETNWVAKSSYFTLISAEDKQ